jgi:hypothetical protein
LFVTKNSLIFALSKKINCMNYNQKFKLVIILLSTTIFGWSILCIWDIVSLFDSLTGKIFQTNVIGIALIIVILIITPTKK